MNILNKICSYWYDCIKNEDILEGDISINARSKAILYPFNEDPFIFQKKDNRIEVKDEKLKAFALTNTEGKEFYYGYPVLYYRDQKYDKGLIAPLLIIKIKFENEGGVVYLSKDEPCPSCGIQALNKIGLRAEEIASINQYVEDLFFNDTNLNAKELSSQILEIIKKETSISIVDDINPSKLSNSIKLTKEMTAGLYNKSIIFSGESTVFNIHLIKDLLELKKRDDLDKTSLSFFSSPIDTENSNEIIPILPFPSNEYQISAIKDIFRHSLSVITGPPGTGKSQFISNLIINLFLQGKSVLFVSHTGEAVDVVNAKINDNFKNLMLRTGKKELRQDLKGRFNELTVELSKKTHKNIGIYYIHSTWKTITEYRNGLLRRDELEQDFQQKYFYQQELKNILHLRKFFIKKIQIFIESIILNFRISLIKKELEKLPSKTDFEFKINELEKEYYNSCQDYVGNIYINKMLGSGNKTGSVNTFLNQVNSHRFGDAEIKESSFVSAMQVLKIWSSTLKSLRGTFPLKSGIFDYVIFDEASQVDLPSAAPALYRAKKAIIVGDPMQLTHIAGITSKIDKELARMNGLTEIEGLYPSKIRYCDVSLYKAAENSLKQKPILLTNHYRSEDQIISLCNDVFYNRQLKILSTLDYKKFPTNLPLGIIWEDVKGEVIKHPSGSRINQKEVDETFRVFQNIIEKISGTNLTIGIVTPYSRQRSVLNEKITSQISPDILEKHKVKILTAHQFQGSEKDIVIFSLVVSSEGNGNDDKWYNIYPQILNVALSRARYLLCIVGDISFCESRDGVLNKIATTYNKIKKEEKTEEYNLQAKFDTPTERIFFEELQKSNLESYGYKIIPKFVAKRYTLDFALIGNKKIDIEIDGTQHEVIAGIPVCGDIERDKFLKEKEGWVILRFSNYRILSEMPKIIEELLLELKRIDN